MEAENRAELETFYRQTDYVVDDGDAAFTIRLDRDNAELNNWLREHQVGSWAFLTAYNPRSEALSQEQNDARQSELITVLEEQNYRNYQGRGVGDDWEEPSLFICEITREAAINIGKRFEQNAILWGEMNKEPELIWCVDQLKTPA
jgi:hypothetical protein